MKTTITEKDGLLVVALSGGFDTVASNQAECDLAPVFERADCDVEIDCSDTVYISWSPDRPELRAARVYKLKGATSLTGPWAEADAVNPPAEFRQTNSFFKVTVELAP